MDINVLILDFLMEIKKNVPRFLSILLIAALGVAFFSGVRATEPDMQKTADALYDEAEFMDITIMNTLGFSAEDVKAVQQVDGVKHAEGLYSKDVLADVGNEQYVMHLMSLPETLNFCTVTEGRLPERASECLVDAKLAEKKGFQVGSKITIYSGDKSDIMESMNMKEFKIVGFGSHPSYISLNRGTSAIGDGLIDGFMMVHPMAFSMEAYTEIAVTTENTLEYVAFQSDYEKAVGKVIDRIGEIEGERSQIRYDSVREQAETEVAKAETELQAAEQELADSKARLEQAEAELNQAKLNIQTQMEEVITGQTTVTQQETALNASATALATAKAQLDATKTDILTKQNLLAEEKNKLDTSRGQITDSYSDWERQTKEMEASWNTYNQAAQDLNGQMDTLNAKYTQLEALLNAYSGVEVQSEEDAGIEVQSEWDFGGYDNTDMPTDNPTPTPEPLPTEEPEEIRLLRAEIASLEEKLLPKRESLEKQRATLDETQVQLNETKTELDRLNETLNQEITLYNNSVAEITQAAAQVAVSEADYNKQKATLDAGREALAAAKQAIANGQTTITAAQDQIAAAEQELLIGKQAYESAVVESEQKLKDARTELNSQKRKITQMEVPEWYIGDRNYVYSYAEFGADTQRMGAIGKVFPLIFFLVAALVCLATITRMVEEQRTQIGTFKALGYSKAVIAGKYICYAVAATLLGGLIGLILGQKILPTVIINAYKIVYISLGQVVRPLHFWYSVSSCLFAVLCTALAAFFACYNELRAVPAELIRPKAPKNGRRVILERVPAVWKRLNFSQKSTIRNMFRYKKRLFMTVFGIAVCMGLLMVGFGLKDSVNCIAEKQFGELTKYTTAMNLETTDLAPVNEVLTALEQDERVKGTLMTYQASVDVERGSGQESAQIVVAEDGKTFANYMTLRQRRGGKTIKLSNDGAVISEKLAKLLDVEVGDKITLIDHENYHVSAKVAAITENYYMHYIYMTSDYYSSLFGVEADFNTILVLNKNMSEKKLNQFVKDYHAYEAVGTVSNLTHQEDTIKDMLGSMNMVILVLILCAALLAFVVLFNLNNINITERRRELASLKVLGFYNEEVTVYVLRENVMLTIIGVILGFGVGILLHQYVIRTVEVDTMMFGRMIGGWSYLLSMLLTIAFSFVVNVLMHWKLKKINMVESLKNVE